MNKIIAIGMSVILIYTLKGDISFTIIPEPIGIILLVWFIITSIIDRIETGK